MKKKAVVLLSGGLDSTTCLAIAAAEGYDCYTLSFDYGQRHHVELKAAIKIATSLTCKEHRIVSISMKEICGSALTNPDIDVPDYQGDGGIPITYVPARNTIFLSIALGWAETVGADAIFTGISSVDYSGYPDCRPEYIEAFKKMADLATKRGVEGHAIKIETPLLYLDKKETIKLGLSMGVDYSQTVSCYQANDNGEACGRCDSCELRRQGFADAETDDPTPYYTQ